MIWVLGAGAFGTALALTYARAGQTVTLWTHDPAHAEEMARTRENARRLPGIPLPDGIHITTRSPTPPAETPVLLAIPTQTLRPFLATHGTALAARPVIACCKGLDLETQTLPHETLAQALPSARPALLTGPSFATDIAQGLPTALTLATQSPDAEALQSTLATPTLRLYRTTDMNGAALGGALKNVIAIACGVAIGAGLGESARAALMTRGFAEMQRIGQALGADPRTLQGLSGLGDLALTCATPKSRNFRFGTTLSEGTPFDSNTTVEGAATARAMRALAQSRGLETPITDATVAILDGDLQPGEAIATLLARPLREE